MPVRIDLPIVSEHASELPSCLQSRRKIRMVHVDREKRRPYFAFIARNCRRRLLSAHGRESLVGIKELGRIAAVALEEFHQ
jgi:hypothetical protein